MYFMLFLSAAAKYDAEKEAKEKKESKDKQLAKIEEARRKAAEGKGVCISQGTPIELCFSVGPPVHVQG